MGLLHGLWVDLSWRSLRVLGDTGTLLACRNLGRRFFDRATGGNVEVMFGLRRVDDATRRVDEDVFSPSLADSVCVTALRTDTWDQDTVCLDGRLATMSVLGIGGSDY